MNLAERPGQLDKSPVPGRIKEKLRYLFIDNVVIKEYGRVPN